MNALVVLNDPPDGSERSHKGLQLAQALTRMESAEVRVFLLGDSVACATAGPRTPDGHDDVSRMMTGLIGAGAEIRACSSCLEARGIAETELLIGVERSTMAALAEWAVAADRLLVF